MFKIYDDKRIAITKGDNAEIDLRLFNHSLGHYEYEYGTKPIYPFMDSEGHAILDSEGYPIYPKVFPGKRWIPNLVPQEELITGPVTLTVEDLGGQVVLEKETEEDTPDSIFLLPDDTSTMEPGLYNYNLTYVNCYDEVQTIAATLFEVCEK